MTVEQTVPLERRSAGAGDLHRRVRPAQTAAVDAAAELRAAGIRVELAEGKLKKVFEIANKLDARVAIICGDNEIAAGALSMKDMRESRASGTLPPMNCYWNK